MTTARSRRPVLLPVLPRDATPDGSFLCPIGRAAGCGGGGRCPMSTRAVEAGTTLCVEGAAADKIYFVLQGTVALIRSAGERQGTGVPWNTRGPNCLVGDEALVQTVYADTAVTVAPCTVCVADRTTFLKWAHDRGADAARTLMDIVIRTHCAHTPRPSSAEGTALRRVARWLAEECRGGQAPKLPRTVLAGLLGMLPETLSRALSALAVKGAITVSRREIRIVDAGKLLAEAGE